MRKNVIFKAVCGLFLLFIGLYLLRLHYVQDYSDPVGFLGRAQQWATVGDHADRAPLYPVILYGLMQVLGRNWVFLANIPFILLILVMLGLCTRSFFKQENVQTDWILFSASLLPGIVFFAARSPLLLQLVNPYREPIALFVLLMVAFLFVKGWRGGSVLLAATAGLLLGGVTSMRETSLLLVFPLGLWGLRQMWEERRLRFGVVLAFGLCLLIGLLPLLIKNYQYSGSTLVPAYSAGRVTHYSESGSWDIPIPGMSIHYFGTTAPFTVRRTIEHYWWFGSMFFLIGLVGALKRRNRDVAYLYFPAFLVYLLFHCFYNRYLGRYLLTAEIFLVPIIAYGIIIGWRWLEVRISGILKGKVPILRAAMGLFVVGIFLHPLLPSLIRGNSRTKVWNLKTIRAEINEAIEKPAIFMGGRHFCYRMSWLLNQSFYEYTHRFQHDLRLYDSLEKRLRTHGQYTVDLFSEGNYYIDESSFALASNWLQRDPVFDFSDLSVPFERYGRPLSGNLYRVRLWQEHKTILSSKKSRSANAVLLIDMGRPWDYAGREYLTGQEAGASEKHELENAVQFIRLDPGKGDDPFVFLIESNKPVPPQPYWRLIGINKPFSVSFGMGAEHWAWNLVSESLLQGRYVRNDSVLLFDNGSIRLPYFASSDYEVYADFRIEFFQENPYWRTKHHHITVTADGGDAVTYDLPSRRTLGNVAVLLGEGSGDLDWAEVDMQTTLPAYEQQSATAFTMMRRGYGFVKVYDLRIVAVPVAVAYPVLVDMGSMDDVQYLMDGFYGREAFGGRTMRWSKPQGDLRVRLPTTEGALAVTWRIIPARPDQADLRPQFAVNDFMIPDEQLQVEQSEGVFVYQYVINPEQIQDGDRNTLSFDVPGFNPARDIESGDTRDLGLYVESIVIKPM